MGNDFKEVAKLARSHKEKINKFYDSLKAARLDDFLTKLLDLSELKNTKSTLLALLRRVVDLKEENLVQEWQKAGFGGEKIADLKHAFYDEIRAFYEAHQAEFIAQLRERALLDEFYLALFEGVHKIGVVMNDYEIAWTKKIIEENNQALAGRFASLAEAIAFLHESGLYQRTPEGEICERSYGVLVRVGAGGSVTGGAGASAGGGVGGVSAGAGGDASGSVAAEGAGEWAFLPYAAFFEDESTRLDAAFADLISQLENFAKDPAEQAYVEYFARLQSAFAERENEHIIPAWQAAELAWMELRGPVQIGHPLEYYEDNYTHAVAMEWDLRLADARDFDGEQFARNITESFERVYGAIGAPDEALKNEVKNNIARTQLYICAPVLFYGAELRGLFSAQVVPNDETVSAKAGKKIFAFLNFVYENAKAKPFMRLASEICEEDFLDYGRRLLFCREEEWKRVYEVSTIGHEFGHIFFIAGDSEGAMNKSGVFKNIEEFKATTGGLVNFFYHEEEGLILPVFHELIKRAVGLISWQQVEEVKPYYTEGLIQLSLLFEAGVLDFSGGKLRVDFTREGYEKFKKLSLKTYHELATHYAARRDAGDFLGRFCVLEEGVFLPTAAACRAFVEHYHALHEEIGNELDESGAFERYAGLAG